MLKKKRKLLFNIIGAILAIAVFYYLAREIIKHWELIKEYEFDFHIPTLIAATGALIATYFVFAFGWFLLLRYFGCSMGFKRTLIYFFVTHPAKYLPGKIGLPLARLKTCADEKVSAPLIFISTFEEASMEVLAGIYVSVIAILQMPELSRYSVWVMIFMIVLGLLLLVPRIFYFFINFYMRVLQEPPIPKERWVGYGGLLLLQGTYVLGLIGIGIAQLTFLQAFAPVQIQFFPFLISIGAFSTVAGILAVFAPGGLGVREGVWYLALQTITAPHIALIYAGVSRIWMIIIEALLSFGALPFLLRDQERVCGPKKR